MWNYIDAHLEAGDDVSPGLVLRQRPATPDRLEDIERLFDEEGIPIDWQDETIAERRARSGLDSRSE